MLLYITKLLSILKGILMKIAYIGQKKILSALKTVFWLIFNFLSY